MRKRGHFVTLWTGQIPALALVVLAFLVPVRAEVIQNEVLLDNLAIFDPCQGPAGELVTLSGRIHTLVRVTQNEDGGSHVGVHINSQGSGTGVVTGAKYQFSQVSNFHENTRDLQFNLTFTESIKVIGQGKVSSFTMHATIHVTINANGELTSAVTNLRSDCK